MCGLCVQLVAVENDLLEACVLSSLSFVEIHSATPQVLRAYGGLVSMNPKQLVPNLKVIIFELVNFIRLFSFSIILWDNI